MKALRAVLFALLLLGAITPSAAANAFEAETYPVALKGEVSGEEGHALTTDGAKAICNQVVLNGELTEPSDTVDLAATYSGCSYSVGGSVTVNMNGCKYRIHVGEELESQAFKGTVDVVCAGSESIVITSHSFFLGSCQVKIGSQSNVGEIELTNEFESLARVKSGFDLKNLEYAKTIDTGLCPLNGTGEKSDGSYVGEEIIKGEAESQAKGVAVEPKTKLCEESLITHCKGLHKKNTLIESVPPSVGFELESILITCKTNKFSAVTLADEGAPLTLGSPTLSFANCETNNKTSCKDSVIDFAGTDIWMSGGVGFAPPSGRMFIDPFQIRFECGKEVICNYSIAPMTFEIVSDVKGTMTITPVSALTSKNKVGDPGCTKVAEWPGAGWTLKSPYPAFITTLPIKG